MRKHVRAFQVQMARFGEMKWPCTSHVRCMGFRLYSAAPDIRLISVTLMVQKFQSKGLKI